MKFIYGLLFLLSISLNVWAQNASNIAFIQKGNNIVVTYDLDKKANVSLFYSADGGRTYEKTLQYVSGDLGRNVSAGKNRFIIWNALAEGKKMTRLSCFKVLTNRSKIFTINGVPFEMIYVKGGSFIMGGTSQDIDVEEDEIPLHRKNVSSFFIGKCEVTQVLWEAVMGNNPSCFIGKDLPVEKVNWYDCQMFIQKLNQLTGMRFRLPTEAEWEYAARGGDRSCGYKYSGSNELDDVAWYRETSGCTHVVGTKVPNELGIYDMSGNVWEWNADRYGSYSISPNCRGMNGSGRVLRGGGWYNDPSYCRVSDRYDGNPDYRGNTGGLRLVLQ